MENTEKLTGYAAAEVSESNTAFAMGSGSLPVFATPAMVALMEKAAVSAVKGMIGETDTTVGTMMNITHVSATPAGMAVRAEATLTARDGRKLSFDVKAFDEKGLIGEGKHERVIVTKDRFMSKTLSKLSK